MGRSFLILTLFIVALAPDMIVCAEEKKVFVDHIEVDRKPVKAKFQVQIITPDGKLYKAKTDRTGFFVPAEVASLKDENVGVIVTFKKYTLNFFALHTSNFNVTWVVGVDTPPYDPELLRDDKPDEVDSIYYLMLDGEPGRQISVTNKKPKVTIKRSDDD